MGRRKEEKEGKCGEKVRRKGKEGKGVGIIKEKIQLERDRQSQHPQGCPQHGVLRSLSHGGDTGCCPACGDTASAWVTAHTARPHRPTACTEGWTRSSASPARP